MLYVTYSLNFALMIFLPILLAFFLTRRFGLSWGLVAAGAFTFLASQVVHIPIVIGWGALAKALNLPEGMPTLILNSVVLGLLAGLCEELARYLMLARFLKDARSWGHALVFGAGHGGIEAIIFGSLAGLSFANMVVLQNTDLSTLPVTPEQAVTLQQTVAAFWSAPWYATILGAVERVFAICLHLSCAVMVMRAFTSKKIMWLWLAVGWHALADAITVFAVSSWGIYWTEALIGLCAVISLWIIFRLRTDPVPVAASTEPAAPIQ